MSQSKTILLDLNFVNLKCLSGKMVGEGYLEMVNSWEMSNWSWKVNPNHIRKTPFWNAISNDNNVLINL